MFTHVWAVGKCIFCSDFIILNGGFKSLNPRVGGLEQAVTKNKSDYFC